MGSTANMKANDSDSLAFGHSPSVVDVSKNQNPKVPDSIDAFWVFNYIWKHSAFEVPRTFYSTTIFGLF